MFSLGQKTLNISVYYLSNRNSKLRSGKELSREDRVIKLLEEILKWTRFQGMRRVKEVLLDTLRTEEEKIAYQYSDGRGSKEVAKLAGFKSHSTIIDYWKKWARLGLMEPMKVRGGTRYKRSFSLPDFGIEVPKPKIKIEEEKQ